MKVINGLAHYRCHCCNKNNVIRWNEKRGAFICSNCLKVFHNEVVIAHHEKEIRKNDKCRGPGEKKKYCGGKTVGINYRLGISACEDHMIKI